MMLTEHFSEAELTTTQVRGLDNTCPPELRANLINTALMAQRIRSLLGVPVIITSGYRSPAVNKAVGGQLKSDHLTARAIDFIAPAYGTPFAVCKRLVPYMAELGIGQLIHEYGRWVHASTVQPVSAVNRLITISDMGVSPGIVPV